MWSPRLTKCVCFWLEDGASLDQATVGVWVRENKVAPIEEHLERECTHLYCAGLLDDAENATWAEEDATVACGQSCC